MKVAVLSILAMLALAAQGRELRGRAGGFLGRGTNTRQELGGRAGVFLKQGTNTPTQCRGNKVIVCNTEGESRCLDPTLAAGRVSEGKVKYGECPSSEDGEGSGDPEKRADDPKKGQALQGRAGGFLGRGTNTGQELGGRAGVFLKQGTNTPTQCRGNKVIVCSAEGESRCLDPTLAAARVRQGKVKYGECPSSEDGEGTGGLEERVEDLEERMEDLEEQVQELMEEREYTP